MTLTNSTRRAGSATSTTRRSRRRRCRRSARAQLAAAQLKTAVREGAFPGRRCAPLVGDGAAKKQPRLRVVRIDNVPGVALAHAHAALLAAAASAGKASLPAELVALLASEPQTTERGGEGRLWAAYGSDEASAAGRRTLLSMPQIDELDGDRVSSEADGLVMPPKHDAAAPDLGDEAVAAHLGRLNAVVEALREAARARRPPSAHPRGRPPHKGHPDRPRLRQCGGRRRRGGA